MARLGLGVIGVGRMGRFYADHAARNIEDADLLAVADSFVESAEKYASKAGGIKAYADYHDLLADPAIEAVIIVTPTSTHRDIVIAAAQAGKQIFCEKPTALTLSATDEMVEAVEKAGVLAQIGFMRRFDKGYVAAKRKIDDGIIGDPVSFVSIGRDPVRTSLEYANPNNSGGIILDMGIHDLDSIRWLMADDIERIYTEASSLKYPELLDVGDVDTAVMTVRMTRGGVGTVEVSRNGAYGYDIDCMMIGTKGALRIGYLQETPLLTLTADGVIHDVVPHFPERFGNAYTAQIEHFVDCVIHDKQPGVTMADARAALQASIAGTISKNEGRVVNVSEVN